MTINSINYNITLYNEGEESDGYMYETYTLNVLEDNSKVIQVEFLYDNLWSDDPLWDRLGLPSFIRVKGQDIYYVQAMEDDDNNVIFKTWEALRKLTEACAGSTGINCSVEVSNLNDWSNAWDYSQADFVMSQKSLQAWETTHAC